MPEPPSHHPGQAPTHIVAAGGLLERVDDADRVRICVVHRTRYVDRRGEPGDWVLPKGKLEPGETLEEAALREVAEETGVHARIVGPILPCEYEVGGTPKLVVFFGMQPIGTSSARDASEVREVAWIPPAEALERLTYPTERAIVRQAYAELLARKPKEGT